MFDKILKKKQKTDNQENRVLCYQPLLKDSQIIFEGKNNILACEKGVTLIDSQIRFKGDNSLIYLKSKECRLNVDIYNNSAFHVGTRNYFNQPMKLIISEGKHIFFGNHNNFSLNIWMRNSDSHLIYDKTSKQRINFSKSIYIGDNVWIGQGVAILKGAHICSGSIIGAQSVVANKIIPKDSIWCGNPVKQVRTNIMWHKACVNAWKEEDTTKFQDCTKKKMFFSKRFQDDEEFNKIEEQLNNCTTAFERYEFLKNYL